MHAKDTIHPAIATLQQLRASGKIRAISLDLDDTLWPIWPTIAKAEGVLLNWLSQHAPSTAQKLGDTATVRALRLEVECLRPDLKGDLSGLRRESIRLALTRAGDDPALAEPAFAEFFTARQRVDLFDDALPALEFFSQRWPVVALSNGNADVNVVGIGQHFKASLSASGAGMAKPDVRFFQVAADAVGVAPEHVLHIGDDAQLDVQGAMAAGMHAVWLNREQLAWPHAGAEPHVTVASLRQLCQGLADC
ncbi:HAD family hydrolase [Comamonas sp. Y33R10-2]|uniref:HAD family hydrolase n=1 Tax=Comamonas sp. Y33R10-2 TaxID=2853257 RepID=UPI001C5C9D2D|nr:HAD family hydrolase [Comamonas sp. Y33R10-2]QXZ08543.1 HAD family hydrolase [Comamonas sp. Y33R10-2]